MIRILLLAPALLLMAASGCERTDKAFQLNTPFTLQPGQTVACDCGGLSLTFREVVEDSRCPKGVNCIQAGQAVARLSILHNDQNQTISLTVPGLSEEAGTIATAGNYQIQLQRLEPYPEEGDSLDPEDYRATLVVQELPTR